ncbi:MAG: hypothetical protein ACRCX4_06055 [Bacteroidales bacterium]
MIPTDDNTRKDPEKDDIIPVEDNQPDEELSNENNVILGDEVQDGGASPEKPKKNHVMFIMVAIIALLFLLLIVRTCYQ